VSEAEAVSCSTSEGRKHERLSPARARQTGRQRAPPEQVGVSWLCQMPRHTGGAQWGWGGEVVVCEEQRGGGGPFLVASPQILVVF
jgi:hypothetical protein